MRNDCCQAIWQTGSSNGDNKQTEKRGMRCQRPRWKGSPFCWVHDQAAKNGAGVTFADEPGKRYAENVR